jgi:hypothetical protein
MEWVYGKRAGISCFLLTDQGLLLCFAGEFIAPTITSGEKESRILCETYDRIRRVRR